MLLKTKQKRKKTKEKKKEKEKKGPRNLILHTQKAK